MTKFNYDQYMNKFATDDLLHKLFFAIYTFGILLMALHVNYTYQVSGMQHSTSYSDISDQNFDHNRILGSATTLRAQYCPDYRPYVIGFSVGWIITRLAILIMYSIVFYFIKPQGKFAFFSKAPVSILSEALRSAFVCLLSLLLQVALLCVLISFLSLLPVHIAMLTS